MMKFKSIKLIFPRALTQPQEYQLAADVQAVVKSVQRGIAKYREKMDSHIEFKAIALTPGGKIGLNLMKAKLLELEAKTYRYFVFEKTDGMEGVYLFAHAHEELSAINAKVKLPRIGRFQITKGDVFQEGLFIDFLKNKTFKSMGFTPEEVVIERGEFDKEVV
jgi:hypothetical protein